MPKETQTPEQRNAARATLRKAFIILSILAGFLIAWVSFESWRDTARAMDRAAEPGSPVIRSESGDFE